MENQILLKTTIVKKLENAHAIWFQNSKSFILLEEPAFLVFQMVTEGKEIDEITKTCILKYGHLEANIEQFVNEIIQSINHYSNPENSIEVAIPSKIEDNTQPSTFLPKVVYKLGNKRITLYFSSEYFKHAIHPLLKHLEIQSGLPDENCIELVEKDGEYHFKFNGNTSEIFAEENIEYFTGSVKQQMYSILYDRNFNEWMMTLHASGVVKNGNAVLFSAAGGSGKSSISAILKAYGYGYISDDFIAADENGNVYPFPAAISVKEGAVKALSEFYPELKEKDDEQAFTGKKVRYLPVHNLDEIDAAPFPVKALVFVNYSNKKPFIFEKVSVKEALQLLLRETWVNPVPEKVKHFFDWVEKTSFYRLQYAQTEQALKAINRLFSTKNDK